LPSLATSGRPPPGLVRRGAGSGVRAGVRLAAGAGESAVGVVGVPAMADVLDVPDVLGVAGIACCTVWVTVAAALTWGRR
jgi:hypothetical protein